MANFTAESLEATHGQQLVEYIMKEVMRTTGDEPVYYDEDVEYALLQCMAAYAALSAGRRNTVRERADVLVKHLRALIDERHEERVAEEGPDNT